MANFIVMNESFIVRITMKIDEVRQSKFRIFMSEEGYLYDTKTGYEHIYYDVQCDNFVDAAKIETYLNTEPWTPANIIQNA